MVAQHINREIMVLSHTKIILLKKLGLFRANQHFLKEIGHILLISLVLSIQVFTADIEQEFLYVRGVIDGIISMYGARAYKSIKILYKMRKLYPLRK